MASRNERRKRENEMDTFISRLKGETGNILTQFETSADKENVAIGEDYFYENVSSIFDEVTGICDSTEEENNESEVPSEENQESNKDYKSNFSSLHTKLLLLLLPPVYPLHTASEGSNFDTDHSDSIAPYSQNTAAEAVVLMPLPPLKIKKFLGAHKAPHNQDTAAEAVVLKPLPPLKSQKFPATHKVPSVQLHLSTQPIVSNVSQTDIQSIICIKSS
ncbi:uncharacterized protein LOC136077047 [Hydra vulgaris]|uniref:Uncharacterized protein LOC136077047 n=1 Tax=Hydra vulgaris TaxID=6087 RepID=A0ABM4BEY3_HYDVU